MHLILEDAEIVDNLCFKRNLSVEGWPRLCLVFELFWSVVLGFLHGTAGVFSYQVSLIAEEEVLGVGVGVGRQKGSSWYLLQMGLLHF